MIDPKRISDAVRQILKETDTPIAVGWDVLNKARKAQHVHLTDKEIFLAGAGYMFDALVHALDPRKEEATEEDLALVTKMHEELCQFQTHFNKKFPL